MSTIFSDAASTAARLTDIPHQIGFAVHASPGGFAYAVVNARTGAILAWDGWYPENLGAAESEPLTSLDWDDWDDMPSKLLASRNAVWLGGELALWLMPEYSFARGAASLLVSKAVDEDEPGDVENFRSHPAVAYFPIVDTDVLLAETERAAAKFPTLGVPALDAVRAVVGSTQ